MQLQTPIDQILQRHSLSDAVVASAVSVTRQAVNLWRHGKAEPNSRKLLRLAAYLRTFEPDLQPEALLPAESTRSAA